MKCGPSADQADINQSETQRQSHFGTQTGDLVGLESHLWRDVRGADKGVPMAVETLAFLFTDIEGSTALLTRIGDATYAAVLEEHHRIVRAGLQRFGGVEQGTQGDSFFAVFASPSSCVTAALEIQRELRAHPWAAGEEVRVRMGIHTGEVSKTSTGMVGYEVHRAARIAAVGHGGQVLVSSSTMALVQDSLPPGAALLDLGPHRLS
jgi:class 3 adenylate cyclase